ncbi:hypothetical protein EV424DRAFT_1558062 [Suillus variegatus]|nr:hypothetical protein EV424DRAFT_1558062 [Suillus variegatus]
MVETHMENRNKRLGLPDLPPKCQKAVNAKLPANGDDALTGRVKAGAMKKPGARKAAKELKLLSSRSAWRWRMKKKKGLQCDDPVPLLTKYPKSQVLEFGQRFHQIQALTQPYLNKVQPSVCSGSQPASQPQPAHVDVNQNEHDDDSLPVKVSKGQKLHRDIENVKDSSGGGKQSHSKQCAHSDDEGLSAKRFKEDPNCYDTRSYADLDGSNSDSQDNGDQRCCGSVGFHKQAEVAYALWGDDSDYRRKVQCRGQASEGMNQMSSKVALCKTRGFKE